MPDVAEVQEVMDAAARKAEEEIRDEFKVMSAYDVSYWVQKWYLSVGYKRLCQILMRMPPKQK